MLSDHSYIVHVEKKKKKKKKAILQLRIIRWGTACMLFAFGPFNIIIVAIIIYDQVYH